MNPERVDLPIETMDLQMGPSHPATHGTIKFNLKLEGEKVLDCDVEVGYLHRGFAKSCEQATWTQVIPYTDRLNYASPVINNVGYALAVEKLIGVETTPRCQFIRVIMSELARIFDHLTCCGMTASELGAITAGFYMLEARELIMRIVETVTGARLTVTYVRIGGVKHDLPFGFAEQVERAFRIVRKLLSDCDRLLSRNRIFLDRMAGIGAISRETAIAYGLTGPILRSTGVNYDVRKAHPYLVYDQLDFEIPLGTKGDDYDRFVVRIQELEQSMRIVEQALKKIPPGPVTIEDPSIVLPEKERVYGSIEGLMNHFKIIIEGIKVPPGEVYFAVEGGNGELGFYLVSDGGGRPYRVRVRPPCFIAMSAFSEMIKGRMLADIIPTFGMINMIGGECDR
ncbi:MAG: NADH dehydrogenase (quinone) subunit D [Deltaproteobacteria bacterium RIFCSPLOWO2_02_FULL_57_26]|nr:MAG: NADH dehydrogenase (quinone) subunit D [Deltaproteobacteria bacterium RIFCSPLOWO2_02_FULL_57_26]